MRDYTNVLKLIECLNDGKFHSGEALASSFGVTRAAINKYINQIKKWGVALNSVTNKGYQLITPIDLLDQSKIANYYQNLSQNPLDLELVPVIDSTNQYLLDKVLELKSGFACVSEYQTAGKGRRGRKWHSPFGCNIYFSMYYRLEQGPAAAMGLSLAVGMIAAKVLRELTGKAVNVKWPNDLYLDDKKLAGILVEITGKAGDIAHVVIGMGINLNMPKDDGTHVDQLWSNLGAVDRNLLIASLLNQLRADLITFESKGFEAFVDLWQSYDNFAGRAVKLLIGDKVIKGIAKGINRHGAILIERDNQIESYVGGEISLRADV